MIGSEIILFKMKMQFLALRWFQGLDYVVALNKVPLQFTKDCINNPKKKHRLRRNKVEYEQLSLFGDVEAEQDITWRVIAEPFYPKRAMVN